MHCRAEIPRVRAICASVSKSKASFSSGDTWNGSTATGVAYTPRLDTGGPKFTGGPPEVAEARAISTASAAARSTASGVRSLVEANPQAPPATTRTPMPAD